MTRLIPILLLCLLPELLAQELVFSVRETVTATVPAFERSEVWFADGGMPRPLLPKESLQVILGDLNQNGLLDDEPADIDAFHIAGAGGLNQWFFSTTVSVVFPGGVTVRDGDVFAYDTTGQVQIAISEDVFAALTSTTLVDVNAFCMGNNGEFYFSFEEDEVTTDPNLIAQNGGVALLDEQTIFRMDPTATSAVIHFTKDQVVNIWNQALGLAATTVVDTTGITIDPQGAAGDLLMCCGSTSAALKGMVVSSAGGGTPYLVQSMTTKDWFTGMGSVPGLDALSLTAGAHGPTLRSVTTFGSSSSNDVGAIRVSGATPGGQIRLVATPPVMPTPTAWVSPQTSGFRMLYPNRYDPFFAASFSVSPWLLIADQFGEATYAFDFQGLPPGTAAVIQAIELPSGATTNPVHVGILP